MVKKLDQERFKTNLKSEGRERVKYKYDYSPFKYIMKNIPQPFFFN